VTGLPGFLADTMSGLFGFFTLAGLLELGVAWTERALALGVDDADG
jgi:hypothetical protein